MKVVVLMGEACPGVTHEELVNRWKTMTKRIPAVTALELHPRSEAAEGGALDALVADADALIGLWIQKDTISREFLDRHPKLKYIATLAHGYMEFNVPMTLEKGITITNTVYGDVTIAQFAMALLLDICHDIGGHDAYVRREYWLEGSTEKKYTSVKCRQYELYGKTMGILGLGAIGYWVARMAAGFGMKVIAYSRHRKEGERYDFIEQVSLEELLARSDVLSLNCPLTSDTRHIINAESIGKMKDGAILINTARGALVDEEALLEALNRRKLYAAGLDVLEQEPPKKPTPLMGCPYCRITGHIAWLTAEARLRSVDLAIDNFKSYLEGKPVSVINH